MGSAPDARQNATLLEQAILGEMPSAIKVELAAEAEARERERKARARSAAIAAGMEAARQQGVHVGRPAEGESVDVFLTKPTSQRMVAVLHKVAAAVGHVSV